MDNTMISPSPSNLTKAQISKFAEDVAQALEFEPGSSLDPIVEALGGQVNVEDFWDLENSESGSIVINSPRDFKITLASHTSTARDRFTIAHELGHYFLHYLIPLENGEPPVAMRAARAGYGRTELEANWFAASFLMPEASFKQVFEESNGDLWELASHFKVSESAARVRAVSLGLQ